MAWWNGLHRTCYEWHLEEMARYPSGGIELLRGSWDLVTRVISILIGVISRNNYSYLTYNPTY